MTIYNDFPIMSNEQYLNLESEYKKSINNNFVYEAKKMLAEILNNITLISHEFNMFLSSEINNCKSEILDLSNSFYFLYPKHERFTIPETNPNIFFICHQISELSILISSQQKQENKKYCSSALLRLNQKCLNVLSKLLKALSKSEVKFYKFM
ncbi:MAG: hypothetical protein IJX26_01035 [Clostridia bacterium]|nr:hypothetical protein [Clostridia bacterium]